MADILLPPYLYPDDESVEVVDRTSSVFRPEFAPGIVQRQEQSAPILRIRQRYSGMSSSERGAILAFARQCKGRVNGVYLTPLRYTQRGSFPATELLSNGTFANGTTGWSSYDATTSLSAADRRLRSTSVSGPGIPFISQQITGLTQYAPYCLRFHAVTGRGSPWSPYGAIGSVNGGGDYGISPEPSSGQGLSGAVLRTLPAVIPATSAYFGGGATSESGRSAGDYLEFDYTSFSRCALVDNGPNLLLRSDAFDNAAWTKTALTVSADAIAAPDGVVSADNLVETAASSGHDVLQTVTVASGAADYCVCVALRPNGRTWAFLQLIEGTGGTGSYQMFNLSTGALGTAAGSGANWSNRRAFVASLGNSWVLCCLVARKTNAATSISAQIGAATSDSISAASYAGSNGLTAFAAWRATMAQSSVPTRLVQTTSAASSGTSQTGSALYIKGLPASTNGLLLAGDFFEVNGELKQVTAALNSDAAGLGYLQFEPTLFRSPADNAPVIINRPFGKFILANNARVQNRLGAYADLDFEFEEVYE